MYLPTIKRHLLLVLWHMLTIFIANQLVDPASSWPWRNVNNLGRISNKSNWRARNILAMAANKSICNGDFYFMLDSSSSIGEYTFSQMTKYVKRVITMFSPEQVQYDDLNIGLVRFSTRADVLSKLAPPNDTLLAETISATPYAGGGKSSIVRAFRLMTNPALWEANSPAYYEDEIKVVTRPARKLRRQRVSRALDDPLPLLKYKRNRLLVVFTDGNFGDSEAAMTMATLGVCRQMAAPVILVGVKGQSSEINVRNLGLVADSVQHLYFLGSLASDAHPANDELSAWNLAAYLCYSLQKRSLQKRDIYK